MREWVYNLYNKCKDNHHNSICFYRNNLRFEKTFGEFVTDVNFAIAKLNHLKETIQIKNVAIVGPVSYDWSVIDWASIIGGFFSIAVPESLPEEKIKNILNETQADVVLMDIRLKNLLDLSEFNVYYFETYNLNTELDFWMLQESNKPSLENIIREDYSLVFSSGTSENIKHIKRTFPVIKKEKQNLFGQIGKMGIYIKFMFSFWSRKNNKLIIFMPFSHPQQRDFFRLALNRGINIILSDPKNCIKHIIVEKPNIMVSVPVVYEAMAERIKSQIGKFGTFQNLLFTVFTFFKINTYANSNIIKKIFSLLLFKKIKKVYGGRADYFITGSAPISSNVIETFYAVGVKLLQAYGQSETGIIAMNSNKHFKIGSVGKPVMEVKIRDDSEIMVKYDSVWHSSNRGVLNIDEDNYIHTGDLGYLDKSGYLFITGRKDDVIVLENGKKIFPEKIESLIKVSEIVKDVCVIFTEGYKLQAILDCVGNPNQNSIIDFIQSINKDLSSYERLLSFHISETAFTMESGLLTATYKKKRHTIKKYFSNKEFITV